jgi:branched-chain amino acid aminotransferase
MTISPFNSGCAWIEGEYVPIRDARIPITDTGFTRSDATYDVVAVWNGKFFRIEDHFNRFEASWRRLRMTPKLSTEEMQAILFECVRRSGLRNAYVEMILSRGLPPAGARNPLLFENRFYAYAIPYIWIVTPEDQEVGTHLVICKETIRIPSKAVNPTVKNFQWGDLVRGMLEAYDRGGDHALLVDSDGNITEGPGFNLFAYHKGILLTPAHGVLEGITRKTVLELAEEQNIPTTLEMFDADVLRSADEIFLASTAGGIIPVTKLDGRQVGDGKPGDVTMRLRRRYWEAHDEDRWVTPVDYANDV